uniref:Retrovirus-related Pol polyprotein from transposon TNT 1-94 n=1 Tax=Tanacetum cinerariifolium TaxID=118510 RepID=A0A6L2J778_TANCI|nr:retrovirus-related Pol polyprotein from transposon TNT 1-94 [Tanacetum cinerariifolium]
MISNDSLKIDKVEDVDNLGFNLLSIGQICNNKCRVTFSEHDSEITKDGKVIGRGIRNKGLYVMKLGNKPKDQICLATIDENSILWHSRLGYANMRLIKSLASKEFVRILPKLKFDQHFYDPCKIRKQAHASHKAKNIVSTSGCLELLHINLSIPSVIRSYGGNYYTLVIVDDYSRRKIIPSKANYTDLVRRSILYELSQNINNLEKELNNEILHEKDSKSALSVIKVQFDKFIHSDMLKPFNPYSSSASYDQKCIVKRGSHEQELQNGLKRLNDRKLHIQKCKVQEVKALDDNLGDKDCSRIISYKRNDQGLENQSNTSEMKAAGQGINAMTKTLLGMIRTSNLPMTQNQWLSNVIPYSPDIFDNEIETDHNAVECDDERFPLANLNANLKLDVDENKKIQKQLKKENISLTQELKECKFTFAETSRTLRESNSIRDSFLVAFKTNRPSLRSLMPLAIKTGNDSFTFVHELKQEMHADLKYVESLENEIDDLESDKAEFSNIANHDECILIYLSKVHSHASAKKKDAQSRHKFSLNKSSNVYLKRTPTRSGHTWKPTGRIFTQVGLKWIAIRKLVEIRYNMNDSASPLRKETHNPKTVVCANSSF